ncbi:MAG: PorV/PorQ family protein [bacterium]
MKLKLVYIQISIALFIVVSNTSAFDKVGTTAAQFLQIGVGGRIPGTGGAGVAAATGPEALYWNPARITQERRFSIYAYYADWIADLRHQFIGFTMPLSSWGVIGFSVVSLGGDEFEQTTLTFQEGNGVMVEYRDIAAGVTYAHQLTDRLSAGGTVKYIHQKLFHETASAFALDLGTSLKTDLSGLTIGMAMTNLGNEMKLAGRDLLTSGADETQTEYQVSAWPLPLTFQAGIGWQLIGAEEAFWKHEDFGGLLLLVDGQHINEGLTRWRTGLEYDFRRTLFLRIGRVFEHHSESWTFGAGLSIPITSYLIRTDFAYADLGDLQSVQRVSLQISGR